MRYLYHKEPPGGKRISSRRNGLRSHGLSFEWTRREETLKKVSELDGIYVIRTSEPGGLLPAEDTVRKYKS